MFALVDSSLIRQALVSVLSAWVMGQAIAFVYQAHREKEASRSFLQALVAGGIVGSMLMLAIGNSLARGVGIVATLSLIRFRTNLRDPLDMIFIFASFAGGIAAGTGNSIPGFLGTGMFLAVMAGMRWLSPDARGREAELRVRMKPDDGNELRLRDALRAVATAVQVLKRRDVTEKETRFNFRVGVKSGDGTDIVRAVRAVPGVQDVAIDLEEGASPGNGGDDD